MKLFAIASTGLRRFARDKSNIFFVLVFPLAIVLLIGIQFSDVPTPRLGVTAPDDPLSQRVVDALRGLDRLELELFDDQQALIGAVEAGDLDAGVVIPPELAQLRGDVTAGASAEIAFISPALGVGPQLRALVADAVGRALALPTAVRAAAEHGIDLTLAEQAASGQEALVERITVATTTTGERLFPEDVTGYDVGAAGQLVLFVFLTSLTGSATIIQSRNLRVTSRMLSTPTAVRTIIAGEAGARFAIALSQGLYIMVATTILFGVGWGSLLASGTILVAFAAVGAGAALLAGSVFHNDQQAGGVTVVLAIGMAALGGSMLPTELFSDTMLTIARFTPHFWALDAFATVVRHEGAVLDIGQQLAVLAGYAIVLLALATWRMRVTLTGST